MPCLSVCLKTRVSLAQASLIIWSLSLIAASKSKYVQLLKLQLRNYQLRTNCNVVFFIFLNRDSPKSFPAWRHSSFTTRWCLNFCLAHCSCTVPRPVSWPTTWTTTTLSILIRALSSNSRTPRKATNKTDINYGLSSFDYTTVKVCTWFSPHLLLFRSTLLHMLLLLLS